MPMDKMLKFFMLGSFPNGAIGGLALNFLLSGSAMLAGFLLGLLIALGRTCNNRALNIVCTAIVEVLRALPLLLITFWFVLTVPLIMGKAMPAFFTAFLALSLYSAVNQAEIFRGGIMNIDRGQWQVASCTGLSRVQTMVYVVLPQMFRMVLPAYIGFFISLFKDTSIVTMVGLIDLTFAGVMVSQRYPSDMFLCYALMAVIFFVICFALSKFAKRLEKRIQVRYGS